MSSTFNLSALSNATYFNGQSWPGKSEQSGERGNCFPYQVTDGRLPSSSTRCWMQRSRRWPTAMPDPSFTLIVKPTIDGLVGSPGSATRSLVRSMSRKGCSPDNAACESFFGRLKTELFYPRDWKSTAVEQFIKEVNSYIRRYNEKRIKISVGSLSPIEYRESLGLTAKTQSKFLSVSPVGQSSTGANSRAVFMHAATNV